METSLAKQRVTPEKERDFTLSGNGLTRIAFSHLLACFDTVDLSRNEIVSLSPLKNLVACRKLVLNHNKVEDLSALREVVSLRELSLVDNNLSSVEHLKCLAHLDKLEYLDLSSNPICDISDVEEKVKEALPSVKCVKLS